MNVSDIVETGLYIVTGSHIIYLVIKILVAVKSLPSLLRVSNTSDHLGSTIGLPVLPLLFIKLGTAFKARL